MNKTLLLLLSILSFSNIFCQEDSINTETEESPEIFTVVEHMPVFNKECNDLATYNEQAKCTSSAISLYTSRVNYPQEAVDKDIQGKVYISFIVDKDGSVIDVTLLRGAHKLLDDIALEHIKNMPKF